MLFTLAILQMGSPAMCATTQYYVHVASEHLKSVQNNLESFKEDLSTSQNIFLAKTGVGTYSLLYVLNYLCESSLSLCFSLPTSLSILFCQTHTLLFPSVFLFSNFCLSVSLSITLFPSPYSLSLCFSLPTISLSTFSLFSLSITLFPSPSSLSESYLLTYLPRSFLQRWRVSPTTLTL